MPVLAPKQRNANSESALEAQPMERSGLLKGSNLDDESQGSGSSTTTSQSSTSRSGPNRRYRDETIADTPMRSAGVGGPVGASRSNDFSPGGAGAKRSPGYQDGQQDQAGPHVHWRNSLLASLTRRKSSEQPELAQGGIAGEFYANETRLATFDSVPSRRLEKLVERRLRRRLVFKNGECNISIKKVQNRHKRFLADIFTTMVDLKWRYTLLIFMLAFICSWVLFAAIWYLIGYLHNDFQTEEFYEEYKKNHDNKEFRRCVNEGYDFVTMLLFSLETQHTIGYGFRHITPECPDAIVLLMIQSCIGTIIQALMTGMVFAKLSRPTKRANTLMFSKNAVIATRDGEICFMFRVADMRKSHIVDAKVRVIMIRKRVTAEREVDPLYQYEFDMGIDTGSDRLFLSWPCIISHRINEASPLYELSKDQLMRSRFEIIVLLEGIIESTGMTTQARTSYLPNEIVWGARFSRLVTLQKEDGAYQIDYSKFNELDALEGMPLCSARQLAEGRLDRDADDPEADLADELSTSATDDDDDDDALSDSDARPNEVAIPIGSNNRLQQLKTNSNSGLNRTGSGLPTGQQSNSSSAINSGGSGPNKTAGEPSVATETPSSGSPLGASTGGHRKAVSSLMSGPPGAADVRPPRFAVTPVAPAASADRQPLLPAANVRL